MKNKIRLSNINIFYIVKYQSQDFYLLNVRQYHKFDCYLHTEIERMVRSFELSIYPPISEHNTTFNARQSRYPSL